MEQGHRIYAIRAVERMTGLPAATIRRWVQETAPHADDPDGSQLFARDDVAELIAWAKAQFSPAAAPASASSGPDGGTGPAAAEPPADAPPPPAAPVGSSSTNADPGESPRLLVLLAERDQYGASLTEYFLRTEGYRVETVFSEAEALALYDELNPNLAIVELFMDGGGGFALAAKLAEKGSCPMILLSALDATNHEVANGAAAVLLKPVDPLRLISTVRDLLGTSSLVRGSGAAA